MIERILIDNGACYRSSPWAAAPADTASIHKRPRPHRPQTNGKVERFRGILLEEWAYLRPWRSHTRRTVEYEKFMHFHNHDRPHGGLGWHTPAPTLGDTPPDEHT